MIVTQGKNKKPVVCAIALAALGMTMALPATAALISTTSTGFSVGASVSDGEGGGATSQSNVSLGNASLQQFDATQGVLTGVSPQAPGVKNTYESIKQSLPTIENIDTFVSAHPVAIAQLSIQYCDALVEDTGARAGYFPGFDFNAAPNVALGPAGRTIVLDALVGHMLRTGVATEPAAAGVRSDLDGLMNQLAACGGSCPAGRTEIVVKATCAAMLGSAATLIQ